MFARLLIAAVLAALVVPGVAQAHHTAVPVVALDYRNHVVASSEPAGVHVSLEDAGRKLRLAVVPGLRVTVLGYEYEAFLRFDPAGVDAAARSKTALSLRLAGRATLAYAPQARIVHHGGGASDKGWRHVRWFVGSAWRFFSRHGWRIA